MLLSNQVVLESIAIALRYKGHGDKEGVVQGDKKSERLQANGDQEVEGGPMDLPLFAFSWNHFRFAASSFSSDMLRTHTHTHIRVIKIEQGSAWCERRARVERTGVSCNSASL